MRSASLTSVLVLCTSCALAPGMKMDEGGAVERGRAHTKDASFHVEDVTQAVVRRLIEEQERGGPPLTDPLAAQARSYRYTIAPYDVLQVTVWDHPELTAPTGQFRSPEENGIPVDEDGNIFYPYVGVVNVGGKTVSEVRELLRRRLVGVVTNPQLDVRVAGFHGRKVQVTGEVTAPTTVPITTVPLRVQDALAAAKGFTPESDFSRVTLSREGRTYRLDLQALYEKGDLSQNWLLQDGDVLNVGDRSLNKVFLLGEVRTQQSKLMVKGRMTLAEALADPGGGGGTLPAGFDPSASNVKNIYVIRGEYDAPSVYHLDASSADAMLLATAFPLRPRDVVFVSTYRLSQFNRVMQQIVPTINAIWQTYDIVRRSTAGR